MLGSLWFVFYTMIMSNQDTEPFNKDGDQYFLYSLYTVASFTIIVVLLNMLIAIMGNTFAERMPLSE